jgi:hypothetical protein
MTFATALLCLHCALPLPQGDLHLPARPQTPEGAEQPRPLSEVERFRRDLLEMQGPAPKVESKLQDMALAYPKIDTLIVQVARSARANEMACLMVVARRFGNVSGTRVSDELLFQLLARPLGEATRITVETMATLKGPDAKPALRECVLGRIAGARRHATDVLITMASAEDLHFALQLSSDQTLDLQLRGVELLAAIPDDRARVRLVELLSKDPALASAACSALISLRTVSVPQLQTVLAGPALDRGFAYAAFALAQIESATGVVCVPAEATKPLLARLDAPESLTRSLVAVPLCDLAFRGVTLEGGMPDGRIVEALIDVVQPLAFVPNLDLLRRPAEERLLRFSGRILANADPLPWREWWGLRQDSFVGVRAQIEIDAEAAATAAVVFRHDHRFVRLIAEGLADAEPVDGALEVLLTADQMLSLIRDLQANGFNDPDVMRVPTGLPLVRSLQIQITGGRSQVAMPAQSHPAFDGLVQIVDSRIENQLWQLYRNPVDEPDRGAFWRAERRWLDANPDPVEQGRRFAQRLIAQWLLLPQGLQGRGVAHVLADRQRSKLLTEVDGEHVLETLERKDRLAELDLRLLELAAGVPGDRVWRGCVDLAAKKGADQNAVRSVFAVLGPDAVLSALEDERPLVRTAAIGEAMVVRDLRATPRLIQLLNDPEPSVCIAAAHACGQLQAAAASGPLIKVIVGESTDPAMRRECLRALGRVGGDQAFTVLQRAMAAPAQEDKEAALRGLGELRDPRAAHLLADLAVIGYGKDIGNLARYYLQRMGGILAVPALRGQVAMVKDPTIRDHLVMMLGFYQDPTVVPDLMDLLRNQQLAPKSAELIASTTGYDLVAQTDRVGAIEAWWRENRRLAQWQWLLKALERAEVRTTLREDQFSQSAGLAAVPELSRLLVAAEAPRLRVLAAAVLRTQTNEDFGVVLPETPRDVREGIAARYRLLVETARAAQGR